MWRGGGTTLFVSILLPALTASPSYGQDVDGVPPREHTPGAHTHAGFWLSGGLGAGLDDDENVGTAVGFRLGGTLDRQLLVGADLVAVFREVDDATLTRGNLTAAVIVYPSETGALFLKGGVGLASVDLSSSSGGMDVSISDEALGATVGAGYDIRIGDNFYLTPAVDVLFQADTAFSGSGGLFVATVAAGFH